LLFHSGRVQQPLALILYEKLMPGSLLVNRLQDLRFRVQVVSAVAQLVPAALREAPMLIVADMDFSGGGVREAIEQLRQQPGTAHIPVIALSGDDAAASSAESSGATLVVTDAAVLAHLPQLLEQALRVE
jgi:CheY-like chemotaxis protein